MKKIFVLLSILSCMIPAMRAGDTPTFPGGKAALDKYIAANMKYPDYSRENGVEGVVTVGFLVGTDGSINNPKIVKLVDPDLEKEALRLVNGMPAWEPAVKNGQPVEATAEVSVPFILE